VTNPPTVPLEGPERWQRLNELFHAAVGRDAAERRDFLAEACAGDPELLADVERLVRAHERAEGFPGEALPRAAAPPPLEPGTRLGPYEINAPLGAGGMGEVYRARDTRLDRTVAVKILPPDLARSTALRQRFEREARAISALNHPHVCALHDVGRHEGIDFLVMEYLEGESLAARLKKGPLPLSQALRYAGEIARALDCAHRKGIVHRDLKPDNVVITKSGTKLLDFGIAKLQAARPRGASPRGGPAGEDAALTTEGSLLGTYQYMSPEQLEGREADARTDIFAFGAVLHEMLTGERAFNGKSEAGLIAAIIAADPPPVSRLLPGAPPALDRAVARCLTKDPDDRWQDAGDLAAHLDWLAESGSAPPLAPVRRARGRGWVAWAVAAAVGFALAALAFARRGGDEVLPAPPAVTATLLPPPGVDYGFDVDYGPPALSPDGRRLAFVGVRRDGSHSLWVRDLSQPSARELGDTAGASYPFWSPDGRRLGFFARRRLYTVDASGGSMRTVCDAANARGGTWSGDDVILFAEQFQPLQRVPASGGIPQAATALASSEVSHRFPQFLPGGRFLYLAFAFGSGAHKTYVGRLGSTDARELLDAGAAALYAHPGWILLWRGSGLLAQRLDMERLVLEGEAIPLVEPVRAFVTTLGSTVASVSGTQALVYQEGHSDFNAQLTWFDRGGRVLGNLGPPGDRVRPSLSHDGRRLATDVMDSAQVRSSRDVWIFEPGRAAPMRFTSGLGNERWAVWSPDDRRIAYSSASEGNTRVLTRESSGTMAAEELIETRDNHLPAHWSPDGRFLALQTLVRGGGTGWDVFVYSFEEKTARPVVQSAWAEMTPQFSPDGRWIAYASDESGRPEVYVQPFPGPGARSQVSAAGGTQPRWRRDSRELFYREPTGRFMAVPIADGAGSFEAGAPQALFEARTPTTPGAHYDVTADGQRFIASVPLGAEDASPLTLVLNWPSLLRR
jgi:Tol biopolymer transport system component/predicted Ser/Thr protein kinase